MHPVNISYSLLLVRGPRHPRDMIEMDAQEELDVREHCQNSKRRCSQWDDTDKEEEKLTLLESDRLYKVRRLLSLDCSDDPIWALQLLDQLASQLESVQVWNVQQRHLISLHTMPWLRRLEVEGWDDNLEKKPYVFPALTTGHDGLEFLRVSLPKETALSLIWRNADSLKELELSVGLKLRMNSRQWTCKDLDQRLYSCGLRELRGLVLRRGDEAAGFHPKQRCKAQCQSVTNKLPWISVFCDKCDEIPW